MHSSEAKQVGDIALETSFHDSHKSVEIAGDQINLQELEVAIGQDVRVTGLTFVIRSGDNSAWYRDGENLLQELHGPLHEYVQMGNGVICLR